MGAITITGRWRIAATATALWDVIADLETWPQWWPAIRDVEPLDDDAARFTFDTPAPLRPLVLELTVTERSAPHRLVATSTGGPLSGDASLTLGEDRGHTAVDFDVAMRVRSLLFRPLEGVLAGASRSAGRARLKRAGDDLAALVGAAALDHEV